MGLGTGAANLDLDGVFQQAFNADGMKSGGEILVNTTTAGTQANSSVMGLLTGGWVVTWDGNGIGGYGIHQQIYNADGTKSGGEALVNTITPPVL